MKYECIKFTHYIPLAGNELRPVDEVTDAEAQEGLYGILIGRDMIPWAHVLMLRPAAAEPAKQPPPPVKQGGRK